MAAVGTADEQGLALYNAAGAGNVTEVARLLDAGASTQWTGTGGVSGGQRAGKHEIRAGRCRRPILQAVLSCEAIG